MKLILLIIILIGSAIRVNAQIEPDSIFFNNKLPIINKYLADGVLCVDSLQKLFPSDTVIYDFFGFTAGSMNDSRITWLLKNDLENDSLFVVFRIKSKCKTLKRQLGKENPYVFVVAQKLWIQAGTSLFNKPVTKYTISCDSSGNVLFLIVRNVPKPISKLE